MKKGIDEGSIQTEMGAFANAFFMIDMRIREKFQA